MLRAHDGVMRLTTPAWAGRAGVALESLRQPAQLVLCTVLLWTGYYLAAQVGLSFRFADSQIGVVWPANAVLLSALLLTPQQRWWLVIAVTAVAHGAIMIPRVEAWRWLWQIAANSAFAMLTVEALRRWAGFPLRFDSRRQVLAYLAIAFAAPSLFGFFTPAFVRSFLGYEPTYDPAATLLRTVLSNATGFLIVAPVIVLWAERGLHGIKRLPPQCVLEATAIMASIVGVGLIAFSTGPEFARSYALLLWLFPPLLWAAVRFGPLGAATGIFCIGAMSMWGTMRQLGPFVMLPHGESVLSLQLLWIGLCAPVLLLAAVIRERELVEHTLHEQRTQLAHVTRVATAGELSGALAHELRQPLMSILANGEAALQLLANSRVDRWELRAIVEDIVQENRQAANVIARLRGFLKEGESTFERVAIDGVVKDALALGRNTITFAGVDVQASIANDLPPVRGDHVQLIQVVLNLVVNGCESMSAVNPLERQLHLQVAPAGDGHVELRVSDRGVGLPAGGTDIVFEPFFTTKEKGLGLGLAIGRSIAAAHGGSLWGENNRNGGATFYLQLPTDGDGERQLQADRHS
ncbi:MAG: MASE1 domain-containing protein [Gemmatimonadaceae bacterium]